VNETSPTISGIAQAGETLTAGLGTWIGDPSSYAVQWMRCQFDHRRSDNSARQRHSTSGTPPCTVP